MKNKNNTTLGVVRATDIAIFLSPQDAEQKNCDYFQENLNLRTNPTMEGEANVLFCCDSFLLTLFWGVDPFLHTPFTSNPMFFSTCKHLVVPKLNNSIDTGQLTG